MRFSPLWALLVSCFLVAQPARATTMLRLDLAGLTQRAEAVIAGRVTATHAAWTSDHGAIYTDVTILVDRAIAGPLVAGQSVIVRREGGTIDGIGMLVHGAPGFEKDEDVVVFIERRGASRYVVGMSQGKLQLYTDAQGVRRLRRDLADIAFIRAPGSSAQTAVAPPSSLDELAAAVQRLRARAAP